MTIIARCPICGKEAYICRYADEAGTIMAIACNGECPMNNIPAMWDVEKWNSFNGWRVRTSTGWKAEDLPEVGTRTECLGVDDDRTYFDRTLSIYDAKLFNERVRAWKYACAPPEVE